jgi:hypothetical protein
MGPSGVPEQRPAAQIVYTSRTLSTLMTADVSGTVYVHTANLVDEKCG